MQEEEISKRQSFRACQYLVSQSQLMHRMAILGLKLHECILSETSNPAIIQKVQESLKTEKANYEHLKATIVRINE